MPVAEQAEFAWCAGLFRSIFGAARMRTADTRRDDIAQAMTHIVLASRRKPFILERKKLHSNEMLIAFFLRHVGNKRVSSRHRTC